MQSNNHSQKKLYLLLYYSYPINKHECICENVNNFLKRNNKYYNKVLH